MTFSYIIYINFPIEFIYISIIHCAEVGRAGHNQLSWLSGGWFCVHLGVDQLLSSVS